MISYKYEIIYLGGFEGIVSGEIKITIFTIKTKSKYYLSKHII